MIRQRLHNYLMNRRWGGFPPRTVEEYALCMEVIQRMKKEACESWLLWFKQMAVMVGGAVVVATILLFIFHC